MKKLMVVVKKVILSFLKTFIESLFLVTTIVISLWLRFATKTEKESPKIVLGSIPIINNYYWSKAMREIGFFRKPSRLTFIQLPIKDLTGT